MSSILEALVVLFNIVNQLNNAMLELPRSSCKFGKYGWKLEDLEQY